MKKRLATVLASLMLCLTVPLVFAGDSNTFKAGVARVDITPDTPVQMAGYANRKQLSEDVHDNLTARVLVFELQGSRLALVSTDIIGLHRGTAEPLREAILSRTGLKPAELFLSAIHTHAGPSLALGRGTGHPNNVRYTEILRRKLADLVANGLGNLQPAGIALGVGASPIGVNRRELRIDRQGKSSIVLGRNVYGPTDKEVLALRVNKPDGSPLAVAFDYAVHGTSLGSRNLQISGDVLGLAAQVAEKTPESGGTALAFAGASGNINPWLRNPSEFNTEHGWVPEPVLNGTFLGQEVVRICREGLTAQAPDRLRTVYRVLQLPAKNVSEGEVSEGNAQRTLPFVITAARLGDVAFIGLGGEVLTEIGLAIKAGSPCRHTFVITHCNGSAGYLAPKHLYLEGGYEVESTPFSPEAADIVVRESLNLLHGL